MKEDGHTNFFLTSSLAFVVVFFFFFSHTNLISNHSTPKSQYQLKQRKRFYYFQEHERAGVRKVSVSVIMSEMSKNEKMKIKGCGERKKYYCCERWLWDTEAERKITITILERQNKWTRRGREQLLTSYLLFLPISSKLPLSLSLSLSILSLFLLLENFKNSQVSSLSLLLLTTHFTYNLFFATFHHHLPSSLYLIPLFTILHLFSLSIYCILCIPVSSLYTHERESVIEIERERDRERKGERGKVTPIHFTQAVHSKNLSSQRHLLMWSTTSVTFSTSWFFPANNKNGHFCCSTIQDDVLLAARHWSSNDHILNPTDDDSWWRIKQ